jgi:hypothetical protein
LRAGHAGHPYADVLRGNLSLHQACRPAADGRA